VAEPANNPPIESVDRALQLLSFLLEGTELSVTDAAHRLGVVPSTAYRLLSALVYRGFAIQGSDRRYRLGPALLAPRDEPLTLSTLRTTAHPALERLHRTVGETVQLMVLQGPYIRFVDGIECELPLRVGVRISDKMPAHCSAGGKAILAALGNADFDAVYRGGLPEWPTARITTLGALKRQLAQVRKTGYGTNSEETEQGVSGMGMAIRDPVGRPIAAFTVAVPSARFVPERFPAFEIALTEAVSATEEQLNRGITGTLDWAATSSG
jgi:IclR family acetate operon transcriptional repressor